jgi:hypothetical protein
MGVSTILDRNPEPKSSGPLELPSRLRHGDPAEVRGRSRMISLQLERKRLPVEIMMVDAAGKAIRGIITTDGKVANVEGRRLCVPPTM